jgi:hypothetical protein
LLKALHDIESIKNPTASLELNKAIARSPYYKYLLALFRHPQAPLTFKEVLKECNFRIPWFGSIDDEVYVIAGEVFDNIVSATKRSLLLQSEDDLCKEELLMISSKPTNSYEKFRRRQVIEKLNVISQNQAENNIVIDNPTRKVRFSDENKDPIADFSQQAKLYVSKCAVLSLLLCLLNTKYDI